MCSQPSGGRWSSRLSSAYPASRKACTTTWRSASIARGNPGPRLHCRPRAITHYRQFPWLSAPEPLASTPRKSSLDWNHRQAGPGQSYPLVPNAHRRIGRLHRRPVRRRRSHQPTQTGQRSSESSRRHQRHAARHSRPHGKRTGTIGVARGHDEYLQECGGTLTHRGERTSRGGTFRQASTPTGHLDHRSGQADNPLI